MSSACRVCLAGNTVLHSLENKQLIIIYEKLSNTKFISEDARPRALCHICYQKLLRCYTFSEMACRSEKMFNKLYHKDLEPTHGLPTEAHRGMKQHLSTATMQLGTIDDNATNAGFQVTIKDEKFNHDIEEMTTEQNKKSQLESEENQSDQGNQVTIKDEPIPSVDFKEDNIWVEVNSVPEDGMKSQLESEENQSDQINQVTIKDEPIPSIDLKENDKWVEVDSVPEEGFKSHIERKKIYVCNVCDKQYSRKYDLDNHTTIHTGQKPFDCNVCDKKFRLKHTLHVHMRTHTGEKPFACNICDKQFRLKNKLVVHMLIHTGEKPFACNVCDKKFRQKCTLIEHIKIHTGEKPFACNVCDRQFAHKSAQKRHQGLCMYK